MAERSTWPETHLNAVNKLLCWDCSFLGKATRSAGTSHNPTSCAVHLAVRREWQVGEKSSSFGYCGRKRGPGFQPIPYHPFYFLWAILVTPQVGAISETLINPLLIKRHSELKCVTPTQMCQWSAFKRMSGRANFAAKRVYKDKEISDKTEKCTHIDCCHLGAC